MARGSDGTAGPGGSGYVVSTPGPGTVCPPPSPLSLVPPPPLPLLLSHGALCHRRRADKQTLVGAAPAPVHTPRARAHIPPTLGTHHTVQTLPHTPPLHTARYPPSLLPSRLATLSDHIRPLRTA